MSNRESAKITLSQQFESACAIAAQQYADGCDTTAIDAEVDALMVKIDASS